MTASIANTSAVRPLGGTTTTIRPVTAEDRDGLRQLLDSLSALARYLRFLQPLPDIPDWAVDSLCRPDDQQHVARIAVTDRGRVAGIAQYFVDPTAPATAEVAVTIATAHQRRGLGPALLGALAVVARDHGIDTFSYLASPGNRSAVRLMRSLGATSQFSDGLISGVVPVDVLRRRARRADSTRRPVRAAA